MLQIIGLHAIRKSVKTRIATKSVYLSRLKTVGLAVNRTNTTVPEITQRVHTFTKNNQAMHIRTLILIYPYAYPGHH